MRSWTVAAAALLLIGTGMSIQPSAQPAAERQTNLISLLAAGKPAIGMFAGAIPATRISKVLATSDVDFIVADLEHDIYDFRALHGFLLEIADFHHRYRTQPRPAPTVLVKLAHRGGWEGVRYEVSEVMRVGPAAGVWVPIVESRAQVESIVSTFDKAEQTAFEGLRAEGGHNVSPLWPLNPKGELMVVVMIETEEGVRHAEEIISTPGLGGVEAVHVADTDYPKILTLCKKYNVACGIDATPAEVKSRVAEGWRLINLGWDYAMLQKQLNDDLKAARSALGSAPTQER